MVVLQAGLARSLLADILRCDPNPAVYQGFKFDLIARLAHDGWRLDGAAILASLERVARGLNVSCLHCLDEGEVCGRRLGARPCPSCGGAPGPAPNRMGRS